MPNHSFGNVTHIDIAVDPPQNIASGWRKDNICPVCGTATSIDTRIAVTATLTSTVVFYTACPLGLMNRALRRAEKSPAPLQFLGDAHQTKPCS